jgi:glycoprotein endo-alpha-1,2-mannosidase
MDCCPDAQTVASDSDPHTDPYKIVGIRAYRMNMTGDIESSSSCCPAIPSSSRSKEEVSSVMTGDNSDSPKGFTAWRNPKLDESADTIRLSDEEEASEDGSSKAGGLVVTRVCCLCCLIIAVIFAAGLGVGMSVLNNNKKNSSAPQTANGLTSEGTTTGDGMLSTTTPSSSPIALASTTPAPTVSPTEGTTTLQSKALVGVYYYPWHGSNFHNGDGYVRSQLDPPQYPVLGEYDDSKTEVIKQHLQWSRQANVGLWVTSWWGPNKLEDNTIKDVILQHEDLGDMKIALHYETSSRIKLGVDDVYSMENLEPDMQHMCDNYFDHPNYFRIDERPVIVLYLSRVLDARGILDQVVTSMRDVVANSCGHNLYIIGDQAFGGAPEPGEDYSAFDLLDAVTNYDMYGTTMRGRNQYYAGAELVDEHFARQGDWRTQAHAQDCRFIPAVSPGFNDRGVRLQVDHAALSRKLSSDASPGSLFQYALEKALPLVDPQVQDLLLVNSFNEWHEDSQIEPVVGQTTSLPDELTNGVEYEGYGELYLNILREVTTELVGNVTSNGV